MTDESTPSAARIRVIAVAAALCMWPILGLAASVTDYHNDTLRTGWNPRETSLTVATVGSGQFGLQHSVVLDEQVDAQPLVVTHQSIVGQGTHNVVYVVTENDTVYGIDAFSGAVLLRRQLGTPVPQSSLSTCPDNGPNVGIASTPAISIADNALYLVTDNYENDVPVYRLHELALDSFQDIVAPVVIRAAHQLTDGSRYVFAAANARQRSALLLSGSAIYVAFSSYCDKNAVSRGWLLGWHVPSLTPLANDELTDERATAPGHMFLSSIWMSGYGPSAAGPNAPIYFVTGNSDRSGTTYNALENMAESVVRVSPDLSLARAVFTPSDESILDQRDLDFGAGGAILLPGQPGMPTLVAAAGKDGWLYLLDRAQRRGAPLAAYQVGPCFCGPSYFVGSDGVARLVTSGGNAVTTWVLHTSTSSAALTQDKRTTITTGQDGGFFTSISSNQEQPGSAIIWAVGRPTDSDPADVRLFAIDPSTGTVIYSSVAGTWPNVGADADLVPTVANGRVYVASDRELTIFGLGDHIRPAARARMDAARAAANRIAASRLVLRPGEHAIFGRVQAANSSVLTIRKRTGALLLADTTAIGRGGDVPNPATGSAVLVVGTYADNGLLVAHSLHRAKNQPALWLPDR